jgi:hypothetical protein
MRLLIDLNGLLYTYTTDIKLQQKFGSIVIDTPAKLAFRNPHCDIRCFKLFDITAVEQLNELTIQHNCNGRLCRRTER